MKSVLPYLFHRQTLKWSDTHYRDRLFNVSKPLFQSPCNFGILIYSPYKYSRENGELQRMRVEVKPHKVNRPTDRGPHNAYTNCMHSLQFLGERLLNTITSPIKFSDQKLNASSETFPFTSDFIPIKPPLSFPFHRPCKWIPSYINASSIFFPCRFSVSYTHLTLPTIYSV